MFLRVAAVLLSAALPAGCQRNQERYQSLISELTFAPSMQQQQLLASNPGAGFKMVKQQQTFAEKTLQEMQQLQSEVHNLRSKLNEQEIDDMSNMTPAQVTKSGKGSKHHFHFTKPASQSAKAQKADHRGVRDQDFNAAQISRPSLPQMQPQQLQHMAMQSQWQKPRMGIGMMPQQMNLQHRQPFGLRRPWGMMGQQWTEQQKPMQLPMQKPMWNPTSMWQQQQQWKQQQQQGQSDFALHAALDASMKAHTFKSSKHPKKTKKGKQVETAEAEQMEYSAKPKAPVTQEPQIFIDS